jgi:Potential Queuosine, Q, salvage protein family
VLEQADHSAARLVNILVQRFPTIFRDEANFDGKAVRFYKRAQILVADLWAAFEGESYGRFDDIDCITMFAGQSRRSNNDDLVTDLGVDYRIPQMLHSLGCLMYSPPLEHHIKQLKEIENGHNWEIQLRGCSIWCVELIRRLILSQHPEAKVNAILIDFYLYDTIKEREAQGIEAMPHHRTRCIWY